MAENTTTVGVNFVADTAQAVNNISPLENAIERLTNSIKTLGVIGGIALVGKQLSSAFGSIVNAGQTAEVQVARLTAAFTELSSRTGVPAAKLAMDEYQRAVQFAADTPFDVQSVIDAAVAMRSMGVDPLTNSFKNLSGQSVNLLTILGNTVTSAQEFSETLLAFRSATQGMMGVTLLARRLNMTVADLSKGLEGLTPSTEAWRNQLLANIAVVPRFQNGMALTAETLQGVRSNIEDMADQLITAMADIQNSASVYNKFKDILKNFKDWLEANGDRLKFFAKVVGMVLGQILDIVWALLTPIRAVLSTVGEWIVGFQERMENAVNELSSRTDELGQRVRSMGTLVERTSLFISLVFGWIKIKIEEFYGYFKKFLDFIGIDGFDIIKALGIIIGSQLVFSIAKAILSVNTLMRVFTLLGKTAVVLLVAEIVSLIQNWDNLSVSERALRIGIIALTGAVAMLTTGFATSAVTFVATAVSWIKYLYMMRAAILASISNTIIAPAIAGLKALGISFLAGAKAALTFTAALLTNPITWIVIGITALIAAIVALIVYWDDVVAAVKRAWESFSQFLDGLGEWGTNIKNGLVGIFSGIVDYFSGLWDIVAGIFTLDWDRIKSGFESVWNGIKSFWGGIIDLFAGIGQGIVDAIFGEGSWDGLLQFFKDLWHSIVSVFWGAVDGIVSIFNSIVEKGKAIVSKIGAVFNRIGSVIASIFRGIINVISSIFSTVITVITAPFRLAINIVTKVFSGIGGIIQNVVNTIRSYGSRIVDFIVSPFREAYQGIRNALGRVWDFLFGEERQPAQIVVTNNSGTPAQLRTPPTPPPAHRQHGGPVYANKGYIVGEHGPELFVPNAAGMIIPNNSRVNNVVQNLSVNVSVDASGATNPNLIGQIVADKLRKTLPEIVRNWSYSAV